MSVTKNKNVTSSTIMVAVDSNNNDVAVASDSNGQIKTIDNSIYGNYPERDWLQTSGTGALDNDILLTQANLTPYSTHVIHCTAGTVDVEVTVEGTLWTDSAVSPIAVQDLHAIASTTQTVSLAVGKVGVIRGKFSGIRIRQAGAVAATAKIASY